MQLRPYRRRAGAIASGISCRASSKRGRCPSPKFTFLGQMKSSPTMLVPPIQVRIGGRIVHPFLSPARSLVSVSDNRAEAAVAGS
jgi:hypothetical protein